MSSRIARLALLLAFLGAPSLSRAAEAVSIAAAASLVYVLDALNAPFAKANPKVAVTSEVGSSGSLVVQIENGAPYDIFLSADMDYPRRLVADGSASGSSLVLLATGRLVLWSTSPAVDLSTVQAAIGSPALRKLAIANPSTAPYGRAAEQALARLGLSRAVQSRLVVGENIAQAAQYVETGSAEAGFVALSIVLSPRLEHRGRWIEVPQGLFDPIEQGGVLTVRGAGNPAARRYLSFLATAPEARAIFRRFGFGDPAPGPARPAK